MWYCWREPMQLRLAQRREEALQTGLEAAGREREAAADRATAAERRCGELEGGCICRCAVACMHLLQAHACPIWRLLRLYYCVACI